MSRFYLMKARPSFFLKVEGYKQGKTIWKFQYGWSWSWHRSAQIPMFACHVYNICYGIYCCEYLSLTCHFTVRISASKLRKIIIRDFYPGPDLKMKNSSFETFWMHFLLLVFKTFPIMKEFQRFFQRFYLVSMNQSQN